jgi:hypothetical protein
VRREKFAVVVNRFWVFAAATASMVALPSVTLSAPTGGAVYRAAPVIVRPAFPQRGAEQNRGDFKIPFHIDAAPKPRVPETMRFPTFQSYPRRGWTWQPNYAFLSSPCFANGANWLPLQTAGSQSTMPDVKIGSLAGDPKHSVLSESGADIARLASAATDLNASSGTTGLQIQFQPTICGQQW